MSELSFFKNKKIILTPHSPMTLALKTKLEELGAEVLYFIDKNKQSTEIQKIDILKKIDFDFVLILSPSHFKAIYLEFLNKIDKNKLAVLFLEKGEYIIKNEIIIEESFDEGFIYEKERKRFVFISKDFVSSNNKAFYIHCIKNGMDSVLLTDNKEQINELEKYKLPYKVLGTKESNYEIQKAKYIVFDQGNYTYIPRLEKEQKLVQLWHGVGLKKMSRNDNITYDYFISTSNWTNETNFKNIFCAKSFLNCGYPRNDFLLQSKEFDDLDLIFCDKQIYDLVKTTEQKVVLYMPTHRENNNKPILDFEKLNEQLKEINSLFVIKFHPHVLKFYDLPLIKGFSNIIVFDGNSDIYPVLKYVDILVSDYSSIVYDFLLLDRPIIFFDYDKEDYIKNMELLFDYDEYSPGIKVKTQNQLIQAITANDEFREQRKKIKTKFYDDTKISSSKKILDILKIDLK